MLAGFAGGRDAGPTFFEFVTVMALRYFAEQKCDLVIWETGLGGRLDATNIVTPLASVITNIQFDHQKWLGETLESIAAEKAGIIKPGVPVLTAVDDPGAFRVLFAKARELGAPFELIAPGQTENPLLHALPIPLAGEHQRLNAAGGAWTVKALQNQIPVSDEIIRAGLSQVAWPGRFQLVEGPGGGMLVLDGAHNVGSAEALRAAFLARFGKRQPTLILGILQDKDCEPMCALLAPMAARILTAPVSSRRSASPAELAVLCRAANPAAAVMECASLREALEQSAAEPLVLVAGSLYLIGEAMELCKLAPTKARDERKLNEWGGTPAGVRK